MPRMREMLTEETSKIMAAVTDELPAMKRAARALWSEMTDAEKLSLTESDETVNILEMGAVIDDPSEVEGEIPEALRARLLDLDTWFTAAEDHAENAGEWEHELGDLEDLLRVSAQVLGNERTQDAMLQGDAPEPGA